MMVITAESGGRTFCFLSDLVPTAAHVQPTWIPAFDLYPLEAIESRFQWLGAAAKGDWVCGFGHDSTVAFARITDDPKTHFSFVPL
jgi:glyoxylase-like metal-dependent hydrolase (beta-lactamase superfamily II)